MSNNPIMEPAFVSVDLESSLGIIKDDTSDVACNNNNNSSTDSFMCQSTNTNEEPVSDSVFETLPIMMMVNNQKLTRTSDTYPFANRKHQQQQPHEEEDVMMDESDCSPVEDKKKTPQDKAATTTISPTSLLDPIPVSDDAATSDFNMMIFLQDDEAKEVLVNRISDWARATSVQQNENGYNIVPNDHMNWVNDYTNIDLSDTEVDEDDDTLLDIMEKEAKESPGFVLENIEDRQAFWTA